jgi:molybdopterin-containing oxidoreductase family membrane subunit
MSWYSGNIYEKYEFLNRAFGPYAWAFWIMMTCNVVSPQLFWIKKLRRNVVFTFILSIFINIGMWFERFVIVVISLHRDFLPSSWTMYHPTITEISLFIGTLGIFFTLFLVFIRFFPVISVAEVKAILKTNGEDPKHKH